MKVLVLGGTGAMGLHLVQLLADSDVDTVVTSRKKREGEGGIRYIQGNAHDIDFLKKVLKTHWDAIVDFMAYSTSSFKERVKLLLDGTSQYIFLSSARVYADSEEPITEASSRLLEVTQDEDFLSTDEYSIAKARQEDMLIASGRNNWSIIRPYITYSENRLQLGVLEKEGWLFRALKGRAIVFPRDLLVKETTMTYGFDVSKGIMALIGNKHALGQIVNITTKEYIKWQDVLEIYLGVLEKHLGYRPKVLLSSVDDFLKLGNSKYQVIYDRLYSRKFKNNKILKNIELNNFTKTNIGLKICLEKFLEKKDFKNINWRAEALKDRFAKEITPISEIRGLKQKIKYLVFRFTKYSKN